MQTFNSLLQWKYLLDTKSLLMEVSAKLSIIDATIKALGSLQVSRLCAEDTGA